MEFRIVKSNDLYFVQCSSLPDKWQTIRVGKRNKYEYDTGLDSEWGFKYEVLARNFFKEYLQEMHAESIVQEIVHYYSAEEAAVDLLNINEKMD